MKDDGNTRDDRRHQKATPVDSSIPKYAFRTSGERDRDRILYSRAFRRLTNITQVVRAGEADIYHNRLTHTLEVAQIGRRLAQYISRSIIEEFGHEKAILCDPDVVEAACLAHDLGHPPFGHVAEAELDRLAKHNGNRDGFEGNAQSFRIIARLSRYSDGEDYGLNLSRGTMNAILKYPWLRDLDDSASYKHKKFGAYRDDAQAFLFARQGSDSNIKSLEAQIMDHADAIAYAVHDLSDFYKAGLLDFSSLKKSGSPELDRHIIKNEDKILRHTGMSMTDAKDYIVKNVLWYLDGDQYNFGATHEILQITRDSQLISRLINDSLKVKMVGKSFDLVVTPQVHLTINF